MRFPPINSLLWRTQRAYQVFGANTDVGKTIFTTLLCKGARSLRPDQPVTFLKPVSTGSLEEADDQCELSQPNLEPDPIPRLLFHRHLTRFAPDVVAKTLFQYDDAVSPHIAAEASRKPVPSDRELLSVCRDYATDRAEQGNGWLFLETAGGVHSPTPSGTTQADLYMPLRLPSILVGDARLGGISQTISAFESLRIRGYHVESVLLFEDERCGNLKYLRNYFRDILVAGVPTPPEKMDVQAEDVAAMSKYYMDTASSKVVTNVLAHLDKTHADRLGSLESMARRAHSTIWWPFAQQSRLQPEDITVIDSAYGDHFQTLRGGAVSPPRAEAGASASSQTREASLLRPSFDGSASWWTQGLGHASPRLTLAAAYAAGRYGHVMFAEAVHQPALALAEALLAGVGPENPRLRRVFFSDDGSTGVEVAVKMALRAARVRYYGDDGAGQKLEIIGLKGGYHGDTMGAMDCAEPCAFNEKTEWYSGKGFWFDYPTVLCVDGSWTVSVPDELHSGNSRTFTSLNDIFDMEGRESRGEHLVYEEFVKRTLRHLTQQGRRFGALIIEPVVLGAGGMALVDPLFQRALVNVVRRSTELFDNQTSPPSSPEPDATAWAGLPVIFDEVFTGLYRLGRFTSSSFLGVHPDVSVHAKLLTGGLVPLCTTLASESIFDAFAGADKTDALLHGHSYTAHPVGCQVAVESLKEMVAMNAGGEWDWAKQRNGWSTPGRESGPQETGEHARAWSVWSHDLVTSLSRRHTRVQGAWALGSVLAVHLRDAKTGYSSNAAVSLRDHMMRGHPREGWNVHCRVLGNVLYLMAGQKTTRDEVERVGGLLGEYLLS